LNFLLPFLNSKNYNNTGSGVYILKYTTANHPGSLLNRREYSTNNSPNNKYEINPWFLVGFSDAEASFFVSIYKNKEYRLRWQVQAIFSITLHAKDLPLLKQIQSFFGVGTIIISKTTTSVIYRVADLKQLIEVIIPFFFDKYPLLSQKRADFELFKTVEDLMAHKEHMTMEGLENIISIKASMNRGLSQILIEAIPNIMPVDRPKIETTEIPDPNWIAGFSTGESCFDVNITKQKNKTFNLGYQTKNQNII